MKKFDTYDNFSGNIEYTYENGLLTNILQIVKNKGKGETKIFYDSKNRICRKEIFNDGGFIFRNFFSKNDKTKTTTEYFYNKYDFWDKMEIKENNVLNHIYEYTFEYF